VHLSQLRLRDFRNYARLDLEFTPGLHLFLGDNAQGKTNILEAIYLLATLRSFRGVGSAQMVRHNQSGYFVGAKIVSQASHEIKIYWSQRQRQLSLDGQPVRKLSDYIGVFRAVAFCSDDVLLVKGPASRRRRFIDLVLAQTQTAYLPLLQRYTKALRSRNALLKQRNPDQYALESFTEEVLSVGKQIISRRKAILPQVTPLVLEAYHRVANAAEELRLDYQPSVREDFARELDQSRNRERVLKSTLVGPHRDEVLLTLDSKPASQFASEGQKRSIAIALKLAQAEYLTTHFGAPPVLLIDDVMGELDSRRRSAFVPLLQRIHRSNSQVFMTCTEENWPRDLARQARRYQVAAGSINTGY
jgi:DNA replication and repair protein RecF